MLEAGLGKVGGVGEGEGGAFGKEVLTKLTEYTATYPFPFFSLFLPRSAFAMSVGRTQPSPGQRPSRHPAYKTPTCPWPACRAQSGTHIPAPLPEPAAGADERDFEQTVTNGSVTATNLDGEFAPVSSCRQR